MRQPIVALVLSAAVCLLGSRVAAQSRSYNSAAWSELPVSDVFALLEIAQAEVVSDRFGNGGLNVAEPARLGGFLSSWSQTRYRFGAVDISSAVDGTPLLFPSLAWGHALNVSTTTMSDVEAPGLSVSMVPRQPTPAWSGNFDMSASGGALADTGRNDEPPPIASLQRVARLNGSVAGPVTSNVGLVLGGQWAGNDVFDRNEVDVRSHEIASLLGGMRWTTARGLTWDALSAAERVSDDTALHFQTSVAHERGGARQWLAYAGYTSAERSRDERDAVLRVERLIDGPVPLRVADRTRNERQWSAGVSLFPQWRSSRHAPSFAGSIARASVREPPSAAVTVLETVDARTARIWDYSATSAPSLRDAWITALTASDRVKLSDRWELDASLRLDHSRGSAQGATGGVSWTSLLPGAQVRWHIGTPFDLTFLTGGRRAAHRLLLDLLAVGDPASPVADVYQWDRSGGRGPLVARVGPGSGGDARFSSIDPDLRRPYTDEFVIGLRAQPRRRVHLGLTGVARRQNVAVQLLNVGVDETGYDTFTIPDPNADLVGAADDQQLTIYNRRPDSFGADRYALTTPEMAGATMGAIVIDADVATDDLSFSVAATAAAGVGSGANRGFHADENDPDVTGEVFTTPNAATYARGRLFSDRAYTIKSTFAYRFAHDIRLGAVARYQDGQPFTRLVLVPGLNQGTDFVQAFPRGKSRFAFTGTLDLRLQKGFTLGRATIDLRVDVYNVPNMRKETEERVVTGPRYRATTAVQPPRSVHLGLGVSF